MKSKIKLRHYIVTNLYLLFFLYVQSVLMPLFLNEEPYKSHCFTDIPEQLEGLVFFAHYWYIITPLMIIAANLILKKYNSMLIAGESSNKKRSLFIYKVFLYVVFIIPVILIVFGNFIGFYTTCGPIK